MGLAFGGHSIAWVQTPLQVMGVFSLLGDTVGVVVSTDAPSDTRIERSAVAG